MIPLKSCAGYLWAAPNTLVAIGLGVLLGGRFRQVQGAIEVHGPAIAWVLKNFPVPAAAMTMGHVIFGQTARDLERTRRHEHVHVRQYCRWGPFFIPAYLAASGYLSLRGRDGYRENPFEIEAYAVDDPSKRNDDSLM
ncbi:MAG: hypothetical protein AAFX06_09020 [Planctomycetota bacterium]